MNDTILGLWAAVDAGWSNSIDRHLFGLLHDAYLDAGDQVSADGIDWCVRLNRMPEWNKRYWYTTSSYWEKFKTLSFPENFLPNDFCIASGGNWHSGWLDMAVHETPSAAYLTLLRAWALMTQETRDMLMNAKGTVSV